MCSSLIFLFSFRMLACLNRWIDDHWEDFYKDLETLRHKIKTWYHFMQRKNDTQFLKFIENIMSKLITKGRLQDSEPPLPAALGINDSTTR